ncbi:MAG: hypothetical protein HQL14_08080 [Candidatus Omnitrophica bacterium]|nr:hypothetical protein [Candidatus Omnitrophota bacterium]
MVYLSTMSPKCRKAVASTILAAFISFSAGPSVDAQEDNAGLLPSLPKPGVRVYLSPEFTPAHLVGMRVHPDNALQFDFLIHRGDSPLSGESKRLEYSKLVKYFLASLTIPDEDQWVNLSPYEKDRIIKDDFGATEMGRDLLTQDYLLKQIMSSLIYPEEGLGRKFWDRVYERAFKEYGATNIPVNTFNKVWIIPDEAAVYESGDTVYVLRNHLKVMLEEDYFSLKVHATADAHALGSQIIREIIIPELEKEVNEGKNFANLRQIYSGMILAAWYKHALKESVLGKVYANRAKVKGVNQDDPKNNELIYRQYLKAFKKGVFNYIKEDMDKYAHTIIPRKYFSGGIVDFAAVAEGTGKTKGFSQGVLIDFSQNSEIPPGLRRKIMDPAVMANKIDLATFSFNALRDTAMSSGSIGPSERKVEPIVGASPVGPYKKGQEPPLKKPKPKQKEPHQPAISSEAVVVEISPEGRRAAAILESGQKFITVERERGHLEQLHDFPHFVDSFQALVFSSGKQSQRIASLEEIDKSLKMFSDRRHRRDQGERSFNTAVIGEIIVISAITGIDPSVAMPKQDSDLVALFKTTDPDKFLGVLTGDGKHLKEEAKAMILKKLSSDSGGFLLGMNHHQLEKAVSPFFDNVVTIIKGILANQRQTGSIPAGDANLKNGGIDLNSANLDLLIKRDGRGVPLPFAQQDMDQLMGIQGFVPLIIEIKPVVTLPILSELQQKLQSDPAVNFR